MQYDFSKAVNYHYDGFPPQAMDWERLVHPLGAAIEALARYDQMLRQLHNNETFLAPLRNQEAVLSSRMEGTISTMDEILQYEADNDGADNPSVRADVIETILYQRALRSAHDALERGYGLSVSLVKQMHQQLLSLGRGAEKSPGQLKAEQNYLADKARMEIQFVPISPQKLQDGLDALFAFIDSSTLPVLIKTAIMHLEFEALHPFKDGNGRIGRMLITLYLWKAGSLSQPHFYISGYFEAHKDAYIDMMRRVSQTGDWNDWIAFFLTAIKAQAEQNLQIAESIRSLYEEIKREFTGLLSSKWSMAIVDFLFTSPIFRNNKLVSGTGIPNPTAVGMIKKLTDAGYLQLRQEAAGRRAALYSFEPLMRLVRV